MYLLKPRSARGTREGEKEEEEEEDSSSVLNGYMKNEVLMDIKAYNGIFFFDYIRLPSTHIMNNETMLRYSRGYQHTRTENKNKPI